MRKKCSWKLGLPGPLVRVLEKKHIKRSKTTETSGQKNLSTCTIKENQRSKIPNVHWFSPLFADVDFEIRERRVCVPQPLSKPRQHLKPTISPASRLSVKHCPHPTLLLLVHIPSVTNQGGGELKMLPPK